MREPRPSHLFTSKTAARLSRAAKHERQRWYFRCLETLHLPLEACAKSGLSPRLVARWRREDAEFNAREKEVTDAYVQQLEQTTIAIEIKTGDLPTLRWLLEKLEPLTYGKAAEARSLVEAKRAAQDEVYARVEGASAHVDSTIPNPGDLGVDEEAERA